MNAAWRFGLLLVLASAPAGCAHRSGAVAPGGSAGQAGPAAAAVSAAPDAAGPGAVATAAADGAVDDDPDFEDDFESSDAPGVQAADPLAPWNRAMFDFNDKFYFWLLKPVSRGYRKVVPTLARTGVENFFNNLSAPGRFVNNLLQLKGREATIELGKFLVNSTWGVLGFGDWFGGNPETVVPDNDLGLTLAHYGVGAGAYVVWPIIGPYTVRDSVGWVGGLFLNPVSYLQPITVSLGVRGYEMVNYTSFRIGDYEALKDASLDPYLATRDAYLQYRAEKARE